LWFIVTIIEFARFITKSICVRYLLPDYRNENLLVTLLVEGFNAHIRYLIRPFNKINKSISTLEKN